MIEGVLVGKRGILSSLCSKDLFLYFHVFCHGGGGGEYYLLLRFYYSGKLQVHPNGCEIVAIDR